MHIVRLRVVITIYLLSLDYAAPAEAFKSDFETHFPPQ